MPPLALWDIDDAARFCSAIVTRSGLALTHHDREDLEQALLVVAWEISGKFEPGRGVCFSTYAGNTLRLRVIDWQRAKFGRTRWTNPNRLRDGHGLGRVYERPRREFVSFDDAEARGRLDETFAERNRDSEADRLEALGGLFAERDREAARDYDTLGLEPPRRAP